MLIKSTVHPVQLPKKYCRYRRPIGSEGVPAPLVTAGAPSRALPAKGCMYFL